MNKRSNFIVQLSLAPETELEGMITVRWSHGVEKSLLDPFKYVESTKLRVTMEINLNLIGSEI